MTTEPQTARRTEYEILDEPRTITAASDFEEDDFAFEHTAGLKEDLNKWLDQQPAKWRDFYRDNPEELVADYEKQRDSGALALSTAGEPGYPTTQRMPYFPADKVNPEGHAWGGRAKSPRPQVEREFEDEDTEQMLDLRFEDEYPVTPKPIELWRGKNIDLSDPMAAELRAIVRGSDDGYRGIRSPEGGNPGVGQMQLYAPDPVFGPYEFRKDYRKRNPDAPYEEIQQAWSKYYQEHKYGDPNGPKADIPGSYDSPELGPKILDYLQNDPKSKSGLGRHWSIDPAVADEFADINSPELNNPNALMVRMRGDWPGLGEDPMRTNTGDDFPHEKEITLLPGAPITIQDLQVYHPDHKEWRSVLREPQQRTASLRSASTPASDFEDDDAFERTAADEFAYDPALIRPNRPGGKLIADEPWNVLWREPIREQRFDEKEFYVEAPQLHTDPEQAIGWASGQLDYRGPADERDWREIRFNPKDVRFYYSDTGEDIGPGPDWAHFTPEGRMFVSAAAFEEDGRDFQQWLATQPPRWQRWYHDRPEDAVIDYKKSQQPGVSYLDGGTSLDDGTPLGFERMPVYRPDRVNPEGQALDGDEKSPRPHTPRTPVEDRSQMLDLEFEDEYPIKKSPVELWRGKQISLSDPAAAELRAIVFGSDDPQERNQRPRPGQMQLYAPEKPMSYDEFFEANPQYSPFAEDDDHLAESLEAWRQYYHDTKGYQEPLHHIPPDFESPELGPKILDYLSSDPNSSSNLGRHWSTDSLIADQFAGVRPGYDHHLNDPNLLRVRMRADWEGLGEDPLRTNTGDDFEEEKEITLIPGAPVTVQDLQVWHPDQRWVSVLPEPQRRHAAPMRNPEEGGAYNYESRRSDPPCPRQATLQRSASVPAWLDAEPQFVYNYGDTAQNAFHDWLAQLDEDEYENWHDESPEAWDEVIDSFEQWLSNNAIPFTDDEEDEDAAYDHETKGYDGRSFYLPGAGHNDPDFKDRPVLPDGHKRYYSPREVNPESDAWARPDTEFEEIESENPTLPLPGTMINEDPNTRGYGFSHRDGIDIATGGWDRWDEYFTPPESAEFAEWVKENYGFDPRFEDPKPRQKFDTPGANFGESNWHQLGQYWKDQQGKWPKDREPIDLWRGEQLDLSKPELADVRRMLFGDQLEDSFNLHHDQPVIEGIDDPLYPGGGNPLSDKALASSRSNWDNPEIGPKLLDYITEHLHRPRMPLSDGGQRHLPLTGDGGLGRHWSLGRGTTDQFSGADKSLGDPRSLPVRMRSRWKGQGEDPYRTNTGGHFPEEQEITILPGTPMDISDLEIYNRSTGTWHSVLPEPQTRYAATERLGWLHDTLQEAWEYDDFKALPWGQDYGEKAWESFGDWLSDLDSAQFEEWEELADEEGDLSYLGELIQDAFEDYLQEWGIPLTNNEDDDLFDPYVDDDPGFARSGPPGPYNDQFGGQRPSRADDRTKRYFSPREVNPISDSPARPELVFRQREPEQPFLPLADDDDFEWPVEQYAELERGETLNLAHPDLADVRRGLFGDEHEQHARREFADALDFGDFEFTAQPWGKGKGPGGTDLDPFETPEFADRLLDHITEKMHIPRYEGLPVGDGGLGRHWTTDPDVSRSYAPGTGVMLPVVVKSEWAGQGEDPYRTNTSGNFPDEHEVTIIPGTSMPISDVMVKDPNDLGRRWRSVPVNPQQRLAATLTDFEEAAGTEHAYYPLDRAVPHYDFAPAKVRIINPQAQYYGHDGELIEVGENMLYVSIDDGADIVAYDPVDVRRVEAGVDYEGGRKRTSATDFEDDELLDLLTGDTFGRPAPAADPQFEEPEPIEGIPAGWERYYTHISETPDTTGNAHTMLPTDVVRHYREYERDLDSENAQVLRRVIEEHGGIRQPLIISTDGTDALLTEGNHRAEIAHQLGIGELPVKIYYDDAVQANEGTPVPLEDTLREFVETHRDTLPSFWGRRTATSDFEDEPILVPVDELKGYMSYLLDSSLSDPELSSFPDLTQHIRQHGIQRPVWVRTDGDHAIIEDGKHRVRAADQLGIPFVPAVITRDERPFTQGWMKNPLGDVLSKRTTTAARRTAMPTYYHLTDNADFELDPEFRPANNAFYGPDNEPPGIFLTQNPHFWLEEYDYDRPYAARIEVPDNIADFDGVRDENFGMHQLYVPARHFDQLRIDRVGPRDFVVGPRPRKRKASYDPLGEQDWSEIYEDLPDMVHRGIGVSLPDDLHRTVYDQSLSPDERAMALLDFLSTPEARKTPWGNDWREGLGTSWSGDEGVAEDFSRTNANQFTRHNEGEALKAEDFTWGTDDEGDPIGKPGTAVMFHAERPSLDDIDVDSSGDGSGMRYTYYGHGEREVPVLGGTPMGIRGISWRPILPMGHPDYMTHPEEYIRHTFDEPIYRNASHRHAMPLPEGYEYQYMPDSSSAEIRHQSTPGPVSTLRWYSDGEVRNIWTDPDHRQRGLATELFKMTQERYPDLHHSEELTPAGRAWAKKQFGWDPDPPNSALDVPDTEGSYELTDADIQRYHDYAKRLEEERQAQWEEIKRLWAEHGHEWED